MVVVYFHLRDALPGTNLDNADALFALVITPGFYLHHIEVADEDPVTRQFTSKLEIRFRHISKLSIITAIIASPLFS